MIEGLEKATGKTFPPMESPEMPAFLEGILKEHKVRKRIVWYRLCLLAVFRPLTASFEPGCLEMHRPSAVQSHPF
jgi:hypothetical protein